MQRSVVQIGVEALTILLLSFMRGTLPFFFSGPLHKDFEKESFGGDLGEVGEWGLEKT